MKRFCFDIESNVCWPQFIPWVTDPQDARDRFPMKEVRFDAASVLDFDSGRREDFFDPASLLNHLAIADELISFNGRKHDLIILEKILGEAAIQTLWARTHHDLSGWSECYGLEQAVRHLVPTHLPLFQAGLKETGNLDFIRGRAEKAFCDVRATCEVFKQYLNALSEDCTFFDDQGSY